MAREIFMEPAYVIIATRLGDNEGRERVVVDSGPTRCCPDVNLHPANHPPPHPAKSGCSALPLEPETARTGNRSGPDATIPPSPLAALTR